MADPIEPTEEIQRFREQLQRLRKEYAGLTGAAQETNRTLTVALETHISKLERIPEYYKNQIKKLEEIREVTKNTSRQLELDADIQRTKIKLKKQELELAIKSNIENNKSIEKNVAALDKLNKKQKNINKAADAAPDLVKGLFSGKGGEEISKGVGKISEVLGNQLTANMENAILGADSLGAGLKAAIGPAAALAAFVFVKEIISLAIKLHDAEGAFMATTGASREFAHSLSDSYDETREFGATIEQTSAAMTSLFMNFTDFTFQNEKTRESLTNTATVLSKLGVSTDDFSKSIQNMTKAMGMNAEGAAQQLLNLEKFAEELGVAPSKIASDFAGAGGTLAKFGEQGVQAFKDLQIASKVTGLEMQRILNITDKFDTFEGAATQAGKLNAALGGNFVNAMDLMMSTDPVERFEQIRGAILNAGLSFDEMSYYQKNFYKDSLGLNDVGELALMLSGRTDLLSESFDKSSQSYEDAAERAKTVASFQEQLNILFAEMIPILTPLIDLMRVFFTILGPFAEGIGLISRAIGSPVGLATMITILSPKLYALGAAMWAALGPWALLPAAIFAVVSAIGYFNKMAFHERNSPTFFEGLGMMPEMFSDWGGEIEVTSKSMQGMGKTIESTPIPAAAETLAGTTNSGTNASFSGGDAGMQTVRQPMEINLNGDKLEKFIVEVLGANIKKISILQ